MMIIALVTFIALSAAVACTVAVGRVQRLLRGLEIPLTGYF